MKDWRSLVFVVFACWISQALTLYVPVREWKCIHLPSYTVPLWILFLVKEANDVNVESNALAWDIACGRAISIPSRSSPSSPVFNFHTWLQKIFSERRLVLRLCQISFSQIGTFPINNLVNMEQSPRSYLGYILYLPTLFETVSTPLKSDRSYVNGRQVGRRLIRHKPCLLLIALSTRVWVLDFQVMSGALGAGEYWQVNFLTICTATAAAVSMLQYGSIASFLSHLLPSFFSLLWRRQETSLWEVKLHKTHDSISLSTK